MSRRVKTNIYNHLDFSQLQISMILWDQQYILLLGKLLVKRTTLTSLDQAFHAAVTQADIKSSSNPFRAAFDFPASQKNYNGIPMQYKKLSVFCFSWA